MGIEDIPVIGIGPGSQPVEEDGARLEYIDLPKSIRTFQAPEIPEPEAVRHLAGARQAMQWLRGALETYREGGEALLADITALDDGSRELVNQILGEGEVSVKYQGDFQSRVQESVLAGVWRTLYLGADGKVAHDLIEVADVPVVTRLPLRGEASWPEPPEPPSEVINAPPILTELREHWDRRHGAEAHVINLTLLPLTEADNAYLDAALGRGAVDILSRGYGNCQISGTSAPGVWWVRYTNSMGKPILNTLEVVDVPQVAKAAPEDIGESGLRLNEILEPYWADMGA